MVSEPKGIRNGGSGLSTISGALLPFVAGFRVAGDSTTLQPDALLRSFRHSLDDGWAMVSD